ncbi:MAG: hypothetical protein ISP91_12030 [Pseudomonadales bacterium]|nr:hypothetical protein [Pseudomonadales bacterium]
MALFRTNAGFLNTLHDNASLVEGTSHTASFFNPGSNANQVSVLRINNVTDSMNAVSISGIDDNGNMVGGVVELNLDPMNSTELTAAELESAGLGNGTGKWRLEVTSTVLSSVQSLLRAPDDFQSNLSTWVDVSGQESGVFLDSPVSNLTYIASPSGLNGTTSGAGTYYYEPGDTITFSIGALEFPSVAAGPIATPFTLAGVADSDNGTAINVTLLLQAYDADDDPENGIEIVSGAAAVAAQVDFGLDPETFIASSAVVNQLAAVSKSIPADPDAAITHFIDEMKEANVSYVQSGFNTAVGVWQGPTFALFLLPDEQLHVVRYPDNGTDGLESGTWVQYGSSTLEFRIDNNDDGTAGFCAREMGERCVRGQYSYDIPGSGDTNDQLVLFNTFSLDRNLIPGDTILGVWEVNESEYASLSFLEDGTYIGIQAEDDDGQIGFEKGTYTTNGTALDIDVEVNNDGDVLLCDETQLTCTASFTFTLSGDNLVLTIDGENINFTRQL